MTITPGAYLKHRRTAAGLSVDDVAAQLVAEPRMAERDRREYLELVEADAQPMELPTIVALRRVYSFDPAILLALERIRQGSAESAPRLCRVCSCSEFDPCKVHDDYCGWASFDLCTACAGLPLVNEQADVAA